MQIKEADIFQFGKLQNKNISFEPGMNVIYGKNEAGEKKTYLIDYDADSSNDMTVWIDGNVNGEYSDDMRLSPMIEILNNSDWTSQVEAWKKEGAGVLSRMPTVSMNRGMHRRFMRVH